MLKTYLDATVSPQIFYNSGLCSHSLGGSMLWSSKYIATVLPPISYNSGLCCHYFGGTILHHANTNATV